MTEGRNGRLVLISDMNASGASCSRRGVHTVRSLPLIPVCLGADVVVREAGSGNVLFFCGDAWHRSSKVTAPPTINVVVVGLQKQQQ